MMVCRAVELELFVINHVVVAPGNMERVKVFRNRRDNVGGHK